MDKEFNEYLKKIVRLSKDKISESELFFGLYSNEWEKDPVPLLQLGIAIALDKPIVILAPTGSRISKNLKNIATAIEFYDSESSFKEATERLIKEISRRKK